MKKQRRKQNNIKSKRTVREVLATLRKYNITTDADPVNVRLALEELGPTFVKLGQLIATQSDLFSQELCDELRNLRDEVAPMSKEDVDRVLFDAYGKNKEEVFSYFEDEPHGSASISQVHRAKLLSGEEVAVKVQRIGALESMEDDIYFLRGLVKKIPFLRKNPYIDLDAVFDELWNVTHRELDFTNEAQNLQKFHELNEDVKYVTCPAVYPEYTSEKVLVMEYIGGYHIEDREALIENGYDLNEIGRKYIQSFLKQAFEDGFFQADPHTGNIKVDGGTIVWYDLGMMGTFSAHDRKCYIDFVEGIVIKDASSIYDSLTQMCIFREKFDKAELFKDVSEYVDSLNEGIIDNLDVDQEVRRFFGLAKKYKAGINPMFTMMSRGVATVQGTLNENFPEVDFFDELKKFAINQRLEQRKSKMANRDVETLKKYLKHKKIAEIPENLANMIERYSKGLAPVTIEMGVPEKTQPFIADIVNMIVDGIIIVALLVSASIVILSGLKPLAWGMPLLGLIGYSLAAILMLINIVKRLRKKR